MSLESIIKTMLEYGDYALFASCLLILAGSIYLTFKLRFVQIRLLPTIFKMLFASFSAPKQDASDHTIQPHRALLTAMSTTLGIGTIVAPVIAVYEGGPGALLGFLITSFFGSAATFVEVNLCIQHRKKAQCGSIMGGPMQYIRDIFSPAAANWYAIICFTLMTAWSGAQSNQLAAILDSPLLGDFRIPKAVSGIIIAALLLLFLIGGIKKIGSLSAKLVPTMFVLYLGSCLWIIGSNIGMMPGIFSQIFSAFWHPYEMATGALIGGVVSALRWGVFKGIQANEAGIGTQTIPHSMAETDDPHSQAAVAMVSTYTAGIVAFISGCVALITKTWEDPTLPLGINMVAASFQMYYSSFGIAIVGIAALLFAFGTILGNSYNGSQCFRYLTDNKWTRYYFVAMAVMVFWGSISEVKTFWAFSDIILAAMAILHITVLMRSVHQKRLPVAEIESNYAIEAPEQA